MDNLFLFKRNNITGRVCGHRKSVVEYLEPCSFDCGHYFGGGNLQGADHSYDLKLEDLDYDNLTTILSKEEFEFFVKKRQELHDLGYGLDTNTEKREQGYKILEEMQVIYDKLKSQENINLFNKVIEEEKQYAMQKFNLSRSEVDEAFSYYKNATGLPYQDRAIISIVFRDVSEVGVDYVDFECSVDEEITNYIDYEKLGTDIIDRNQEKFYQLESGRVVEFML